jgi:hypothetical protein
VAGHGGSQLLSLRREAGKEKSCRDRKRDDAPERHDEHVSGLAM